MINFLVVSLISVINNLCIANLQC